MRFVKEEDAVEHARVERALLLKSRNGIGIDMMLSGLADISEELNRASYRPFTNDTSLKVCSADTLIAMKTVAGRMKDYADIQSS